MQPPSAGPSWLIINSKDDLCDFRSISRSIDKHFPNVCMINIRCIKERRFFIQDQIFTTQVAEVLVSLLNCRDWKLVKPHKHIVSIETIARKLSEPMSRGVLFKGII